MVKEWNYIYFSRTIEELMQVVMLLNGTIIVPEKPPLKLPGVPTSGKSGSMAQDYIDIVSLQGRMAWTSEFNP